MQFVALVCNRCKGQEIYRSPWTNKFYSLGGIPSPEPHTFTQSPILRQMEEYANELFETYTRMYYGTSGDDYEDPVVPSAYFYALPGGDIGACFVICKSREANRCFWSSSHLFQVKTKTPTLTFSLESQVCFCIPQEQESGCQMTVSGLVPKLSSKTMQCSSPTYHDYVGAMGQMLEEAENDLRSSIQSKFVPQTERLVYQDLFGGGQSVQSGMSRHMPPFPTAGGTKPWQNKASVGGTGSAHAMMLQQAVMARAAASKKKQTNET